MTAHDPTRFRWVFCQLETLRQCLPQSVRRTLNELPESLDGTYERVMMEIKRANQSHAYRMLQCLTVANRPLSVAELAELLAFDFDEAKGGIPKLNSNWRWEDHEQAVLSTCSSLVTVVPNDGSPIVQFSHFSVKEFLMSDRLATSRRDISQYHISLVDAHTVLAQASLAVLLRDPDVNGHVDSAVLAGYAAEHWMTHARVENVASQVRDGMEDLFDPDKPYFEAWVQLHDIDAKDRYDFPTCQIPNPEQDHCITPRCAGSMSWWNTLLSNIRNTQVLEAVFAALHYTRHRSKDISRLCAICFGMVWMSMFETLGTTRHCYLRHGRGTVTSFNVCSSMAQMWICGISSTILR
jgi:hypothetical protein